MCEAKFKFKENFKFFYKLFASVLWHSVQADKFSKNNCILLSSAGHLKQFIKKEQNYTRFECNSKVQYWLDFALACWLLIKYSTDKIEQHQTKNVSPSPFFVAQKRWSCSECSSLSLSLSASHYRKRWRIKVTNLDLSSPDKSYISKMKTLFDYVSRQI